MQQRILFWLHISADDFLHYYQDSSVQVSVTAEDGRRIQFPARHLRPFITPAGISGRFEMTLEADNKFVSLKQL